MIFVHTTDAFADLFFVVGVLAVSVIWVIISMYKDAAVSEKQEIKTDADRDTEIADLKERYQDVAERNVELLEEINRLRFENSYLSRQAHCSELSSNAEFQENLKDLIILSHPDKHGGHERAKRITQWLLQLRQKN